MREYLPFFVGSWLMTVGRYTWAFFSVPGNVVKRWNAFSVLFLSCFSLILVTFAQNFSILMKKQLNLKVENLKKITEQHILLSLVAPNGDMPEIKAGQFVEVKVDNAPTVFLRRPISVHFVDYAKQRLDLLVALVGDGTRKMATLSVGDEVSVLLPLGNGFPMPTKAGAKCLLVGGGVGIAPLLYLGDRLKAAGHQVSFLLGARNAGGVMLEDEFKKFGSLYLTTEDGSVGKKGFVTNHSILEKERFDEIFVCGPTPMMKAVAKYAYAKNIECYVSLENKMACGLGACLCCVTEDNKGHNRCVCSEGPVFNINELPWQN